MAEDYTKVQTFSGLFVDVKVGSQWRIVLSVWRAAGPTASGNTGFPLRGDQKIGIFWTHAGHFHGAAFYLSA